MKTFLIKIFLSIILLILIFNLPFYYFNNESLIRSDLNNKISNILILNPEPEIIIAGDSRAEMQCIPEIFENILGKKTVNIAIGGCELITAINALIKYNLLNSNKLFIFTVSSPQINDGIATNFGNGVVNISQEAILNLNQLQRIKLLKSAYFSNLRTLNIAMIRNIFQVDKVYPNTIVYEYKGYLPCDGMLNDSIVYKMDDHLWYRQIKINGLKELLFCKTIDKLSYYNDKIIIINPPNAPVFRNQMNNNITLIEDHFNHLLENKKNIYYFDYSNDDCFRDSMFANAQHLNKNGAIYFSNKVANEILKLK